MQPLAIESLISFLKKNYISKRTVEIMKIVIQTFYSAPNYQNRMKFVEIYNKMTENFSRRFFKTHGLHEPMLKLGDDKVPVVRKKMLESVVGIKKMFNANDNALIVKLDDVVNKARNQPNKMVAEV